MSSTPRRPRSRSCAPTWRSKLAAARLRLAELERDYAQRERYVTDPVAFCEEVLKVKLWRKQAEAARALLEPPHQVMVESANNVGKSLLAAAMPIWSYMPRDPAVVILTAPTFRQVNRVTFKEVRRLYGKRPGMMPRAPLIETSPHHLLTGFTAIDENSFQGLRERSNLIVMEECIGISPSIWTGARGILSGGGDAYWLGIGNPTDTTSWAYTERQSGGWRIFSISAFEHPNIA